MHRGKKKKTFSLKIQSLEELKKVKPAYFQKAH